MADRPTGAVTFLFTDVVGSTVAREADPTAMNSALEIHDWILRSAIESHGGFVFSTGGDSFSAAFPSPTSAVAAATDAQLGLTESNCLVKVRMGVRSGEAIERDGNYFGPPLNQTARLMSIGHGGQILVSDITRRLVAASGFDFVDLGEHRLADLSSLTGPPTPNSGQSDPKLYRVKEQRSRSCPSGSLHPNPHLRPRNHSRTCM